MTTATGNKNGFVRRLASIGKTLVDAAPYILADDGKRLTFDIDHPDYPHKSKLAKLQAEHTRQRLLVIDDATAALRRITCRSCEWSTDITDYTAHCRKRGERASCPACRVTFNTSPVSRCPLNLWPA